MYIDSDNKIISCSASDEKCLECLDLTGACSLCAEDFVLNKDTSKCEVPVVPVVVKPEEYNEDQKKSNRSYQVSKSVLEGTSVAVILVGAPAGILLAQTVQTFDYLGFLHFYKPKSLQGSSE